MGAAGRRCCFCAGALLLPFAAPSCGRGDGADLPVLPATVGGVAARLPVVTASVAGRDLRALVDTGTAGVLVAPALFGVAEGAALTLGSVCFGDACVFSVPAIARTTRFSDPSEIQVIVGMSVLKGWTVEIDHLQRVRIGAASAPCRAVPVPLTFDDGGRPFTAFRVGSIASAGALVDTGAVYAMLGAASAAELPAAVVAAASPAAGCDINGCASVSVAHGQQVCVGSVCAPAVDVKYPAYDCVGGSFLASFRARFDFAVGQLALCPGP